MGRFALYDADLAGKNLAGKVFGDDTNLGLADFTGSDLMFADLSGTHLTAATLVNADLLAAKLSRFVATTSRQARSATLNCSGNSPRLRPVSMWDRRATHLYRHSDG